MILEKVYDELMAQIEDLKKQIQASSGSDVTITPALESGVKIADYAIGSDEGVLYAPSEVAGIISTTETKVGSFNGEDVYRKVFSSASAISGTSTEIDVSSLNIKQPIRAVATTLIIDDGVDIYTMLPINDGNTYAYVDTVTASSFTIKHTSNYGANRAADGFTLILEYTKKPAEAKSTRKSKSTK